MEFLGAIIVFVLAAGGLGLGVLVGRPALRGSCGRSPRDCECANAERCSATKRLS